MKINSLKNRRAEQGSTLVAVMVFIFVMGIIMGAVHSYTLAVAYQTAVQGEYLKANAAAEAAMEAVTGRLIQWVTLNSGYGPSIGDCATVGTTGNTTFPAITGAVTFPAGSELGNFTVSGISCYPLMPDDTIVTSTSDPKYLPNLASRANISEMSSSTSNVLRYYFTHSMSQNAKNIASRSLAYKITVTVTPTLSSLIVRQPTQWTRVVRCDKVSPFNWCTFRMGSANYYGSSTYSGPMYLANSVGFYGPTYTDSVLYGISAANYGSTFTGGGYSAQVKQTALLSMIPNLVGNLAVDSNGNRQASFETNTTSPGNGAADPADKFSTREIIEPPTNPANDLTPAVIRDARIYNQADARIQVTVTTNGNTQTASWSAVNVDGTVNSTITQLLSAGNVINIKTQKASTPFYDRTRSTSTPIESTDINVGALKAVMDANPSTFPNGIIYVWDSTGLTSGTRPLTGVRLWNAGSLPNVGLALGSNDPIYLKGDFNTGTTLPSNATIDSTPVNQPASNTTVGVNSNATTESQREVSGYTILPGGVFGDSVTELSNAWHDANSLNTQTASNTTINLVEGWSTDSANELRSDDTYLDPQGRANPIWPENWSGARRTMSGEEMCAWHSKYQTTTNEALVGSWVGDISFDSKAASLKLNWGAVNFVRDRETRVY